MSSKSDEKQTLFARERSFLRVLLLFRNHKSDNQKSV